MEAVKQNTLSVEAGQVYGFLGPNGAGKTTVIRLLLDLIRPTNGNAYLFEEPVRDNVAVLRRVGSMIETPAFYPYMGGRKNLQIIARTHGNFDPARLADVVDQVGLKGKGLYRYAKYSLGMKQRLGLAAALIHDPELLILDEPTNGLDPAGIQEMRVFIRELVEQHGKTVFLSSHMLNEVEQVCDRVAIINQGEIVREGAVGDILEDRPLLHIDVGDTIDQAEAVLAAHWPLHREDGQLYAEAPREDAPAIVRKLVEADLDVYAIKRSLEAYYLSVTQNEETPHDAS